MSPLKIGVMSFAHGHADGFLRALVERDDVEVRVADEDTERARRHALAAGIPDAALADSYEHLLDWAPDGVLVCSENARHAELTELAASAGAYVLSEKPLATTSEGCQRMVDACERAGVGLMTAFTVRFMQPVRSLRTLVNSGELGRIIGVAGTNPGSNPGSWFTDPALAGGGAMIDHTVHVVDLLRWMLGSEPVSVYAQTNRLLYPDLEVETAGNLAVTFDDGVFATVDCSWSRPKSYPTWGTVTLQLVAENGVVNLDAFAQTIESYYDGVIGATGDRSAAEGARWVPWAGGGVSELIDEFVDAIRTRRRPVPDGVDGMRATNVALAAYRSARSGQPVAINPS